MTYYQFHGGGLAKVMIYKKIFKHLRKSTQYSLSGLKNTFDSEFAFKLEVYCSLLVLPTAYYCAKTKIEFCLLSLTWCNILLTELLNTAIEVTIDRIGPESNRLSKNAKDIGSAAVLVAIAIAALVWITIIFI
jgi:diacylglycerol kinase (ATP)